MLFCCLWHPILFSYLYLFPSLAPYLFIFLPALLNGSNISLSSTFQPSLHPFNLLLLLAKEFVTIQDRSRLLIEPWKGGCEFNVLSCARSNLISYVLCFFLVLSICRTFSQFFPRIIFLDFFVSDVIFLSLFFFVASSISQSLT